MRTWWIATAGLMLGAAGSADAQRVVAHGPDAARPGASYPAPAASSTAIQSWQAPRARPPVARPGQSRWGSKVGGRWWGGANAPGGWGSYRRPYPGYALPRYWVSPRFHITDWQGYGLSRPVPGYVWVRYYDDAVLVDARGSVFDTRYGLDWDGGDDGGYVQDDRGYDDRAYDDRGYDDRGYDDRQIPPPPPPAPSPYRGDYAVPIAPDRAPPPPPPLPVGAVPGGSSWRSADGTTTVTTSSGGSGYYRGGTYYPGPSTTAVVVQSAPVVTTRTETYEDTVTYTRRPAVRSKTRRVWRPAPR